MAQYLIEEYAATLLDLDEHRQLEQHRQQLEQQAAIEKSRQRLQKARGS